MKPPILLLHGAIGAGSQLKTVTAKLSDTFDVHHPDFPGHGGQPVPEAPFSIQLFAESVLSYINEHQLQQINIFGYSMGGYVALYLAKHYPQLIGKIITLGTKFYWDIPTAEKEINMLDPETIIAKVHILAERLALMHAPNDWQRIVLRTPDMLMEMGRNNPLKTEDFKVINTPTLIMLGDRDKMVPLEETVHTYQQLPRATMAMLPNTPHPIEQVNAEMVAYFIRNACL